MDAKKVQRCLENLRKARQPVYDPSDPEQKEAWRLFQIERRASKS